MDSMMYNPAVESASSVFGGIIGLAVGLLLLGAVKQTYDSVVGDKPETPEPAPGWDPEAIPRAIAAFPKAGTGLFDGSRHYFELTHAEKEDIKEFVARRMGNGTPRKHRRPLSTV